MCYFGDLAPNGFFSESSIVNGDLATPDPHVGEITPLVGSGWDFRTHIRAVGDFFKGLALEGVCGEESVCSLPRKGKVSSAAHF